MDDDWGYPYFRNPPIVMKSNEIELRFIAIEWDVHEISGGFRLIKSLILNMTQFFPTQASFSFNGSLGPKSRGGNEGQL